jgi:hypothetical protein
VLVLPGVAGSLPGEERLPGLSSLDPLVEVGLASGGLLIYAAPWLPEADRGAANLCA